MGWSEHMECRASGTYAVLLFIVHEGGDGPTSISTIAGLTMNTDSSATNTKVVDGAGDGARRRRHCIRVMGMGDNQSG